MSHNTHQQPQDTNMRTRTMRVVLLCVLATLGLLLSVSAAWGAVKPAPAWQVTNVGIPTVLPPGLGKTVEFYVVVENVGGAASSGSFRIKDDFPAGITVTRVLDEPTATSCETLAREVVCEYSEPVSEPVVPGGFVVVGVLGQVSGSTSAGLRDVGSVSGGGAASAASDEATMHNGASGEKALAGVSKFRFDVNGPAGESATQAAGHPQSVTATVLLNNQYIEGAEAPASPVEAVKDLVFYLPLGFLGNPTVAGYCPTSIIELTFGVTGCPPSTEVGSILPMILNDIVANESKPTHEPGLFNIAPEKGYAAEFAFASDNYTFFVYASVVRHDGAYMLRVDTPGLPRIADLIGLIATFKGDSSETYSIEGNEYRVDRGAFLTNPSDCNEGAQAREASVAFNSWEEPGKLPGAATPVFPVLEGCGLLPFSTTLSAAPNLRTAGNSTAADEPSGYSLDLQVAQAPNAGAGLGTPPLKAVEVTFPEGTALSPGAANGLTACSATGTHGIDFPSGEGAPGNPGAVAGEGEEDGPDGLPRLVAGNCPGSSEIASVHASSPLLHEELEGHIYLAEPGCGNAAHPSPCTPADAADGTLYRLYLELEAPNRGVVVKLAGDARVSPSTGRVTSVFEEAPQFPVSDLRIETSGGPRAPLANPQTCGTATTTGVVSPWSGGAPSEPTSSFQVNEGCGAQSFAPSFTAGTTNSLAGAYSPFTLTLHREDREQDIDALSTTLPEGLLAAVSKVSQCPEPQAAQGACPPSSRVGSTDVAIGSGQDPFDETGQVYFTGPYAGAPFGLSIVVPAVAGPFNLGNVIARVALHIDPNTAQVTAVSDPLPQIVDGVPLRIRTIDVTLDDPTFTFNATNCAPMSITGAVESTDGAATAISAPYQASGCQNLPFKPTLTASTQGSTSKQNGASLTVKINAASGEANVGKVELTLPKILPTRDSTLNQACGEAQFNANPAGCPEGSNIGLAKAVTPLLSVPLVGPAYLVSHGGAAFPDVEFVLQGEGVRITIDGKTQIKNGVTYSKFESVPDAPITSFETVLPEGPHSILAAYVPKSPSGSLCGQSLKMPTTITGQNGTVITQTTPITVTGCGPTIKITKHTARKNAVAVTVSTSSTGSVAIAGDGLRSMHKTLTAGTHTLVVPLNADGHRLAARHGTARINATLRNGSRTVTTTAGARL
jgi:hypothetical protein